MNKLLSFLKKASFFFVVVNIFTAALGFIRSFAFMKFLGFEELGTITMVNTTASLLSFTQIGLINGGYRIIALKEEKAIEKTNNNILSFLCLISIVVFIVTLILILTGIVTDYATAFTSIGIGILLLFNNWFTNRLIGSGKLQKLNYANSVSAIISLLCIILVYYFGFVGALICLFAQPLFFMFLSIDKTFKFTKFEIDIKHLHYILSFGFIPFLSGIFFLVYSQIERWSISLSLGNEELGKMYLFFIIVTLWVLIPNSILNILYPKAIKYYADQDKERFHKTIRDNLKIILLYNIIGIISIILFLSSIISLLFPKHLPYVYLVYLAIPGLISRQFVDPISLFFNSVICLKPLFWSDLFSLLVYCISILYFYLTNNIHIYSFVICFDIFFFSKLLYSLIYYVRIKNKY
jgi:membrane protein